jgi:hypothetical protein
MNAKQSRQLLLAVTLTLGHLAQLVGLGAQLLDSVPELIWLGAACFILVTRWRLRLLLQLVLIDGKIEFKCAPRKCL